MTLRVLATLGFVWILTATGLLAQDRAAPERPLPNRPVVVTLIGTSLTANATWPDMLGQRLAECLSREIIVERVARPAATSDWGLEQIAAIAANKPDIVVIEFAINDADVKIGMPLARSRDQSEALIRELRRTAPDAALYLMTTNPALGRMAGRRPVLPAYFEMYRNLAAAHDIGLADANRRWKDVPDLRASIPDGLHPTDDKATTIIVEALAPLVKKTFAADDERC